MFAKITRFLTHMDARAARTLGISAALFLGVAVIVVMGRTTAIFDEDDAPIFDWLRQSAESPWALPVTVLLFTAASFFGAPQSVLIAGAVVAFGPVLGFAYAWISTMTSATANFLVARRFGADALKRYGGDTVNRISKMIGANGFWTSLVVRNVPIAPFVVINMALGVSRARFATYLAGTAVGIIPKMAMIAFAGGSLIELANNGSVLLGLALAAIAACWLGAVIWARRALQDRAGGDLAEPSEPENPESSD
ncbi:MAG: TVP38/TMEM64 family protein [Maricaulaceae bacterium]